MVAVSSTSPSRSFWNKSCAVSVRSDDVQMNLNSVWNESGRAH